MKRFGLVGAALFVVGVATACLPTSGSTLPPHPITAGQPVDSSNWAGYVESRPPGGAWNSILGAWTVPTVSCAPGEVSVSYQWVGLDGSNRSPVEQIGTATECRDGTPAYFAWYSIYDPVFHNVRTPADLVGGPNGNETHQLSPGDRIVASVEHPAPGQSSDSFHFVLNVTPPGGTTPFVFDHVGSSTGAASTAECIVGAPSAIQSKFTPIPFTSCDARSADGVLRRLATHEFYDTTHTPTVLTRDTATLLANYRIVVNGIATATAGPGDAQGHFTVTWQHH